MIDRTEHDERAARRAARETVDDDPHADHSLDPNEHYGQESAVTAEAEALRDAADAATDR
jgi:hypothetical protein